MVDAYDPHCATSRGYIAGQYAIVMHDGVYAGLVGSGLRVAGRGAFAAASMGADAVGMSTVLETIAARALGVSVVGFSLITNVHIAGAATSHAEVSPPRSAAPPTSRA